MSHPNTLVARTRRSLMALAVAALLLVAAAFSAHAQTASGGALTKLNAPESFSPSWRVVPAQDATPEQALASK